MEYYQQKLANGVSLHMLPLDRYKTTFIGINIYCGLGHERAATGLIPHVLQKGSSAYPTARQLRSRLAELYGSQFGAGVVKRGEQQLLQLRLQLVHDSHISDGSSLLEDCLDILQGVMLDPYTESGSFKPEYVAIERKNAADKIRSLLNDKSRYAFHRCLAHLCPQRDYSHNKFGTVEAVEAVDAEHLWQKYQHVLATAPADVFVCGRYDHNRVVDGINSRFNWSRRGEKALEPAIPLPEENPRTVKEQMDISQGQLVMAMTTEINQSDNRYPALVLYNGILGAFPHSKLFQQVREKKGLAYHIGSSLDSMMGVQFISGGIDAESFDDTVEVIADQLRQMRKGEITADEMEWTRIGLRTGLLQMYDDLGEQVSLAIDGRISGRRWLIPQLIEEMERLTLSDVVEAARTMKLQVTYFLSGGEG